MWCCVALHGPRYHADPFRFHLGKEEAGPFRNGQGAREETKISPGQDRAVDWGKPVFLPSQDWGWRAGGSSYRQQRGLPLCVHLRNPRPGKEGKEGPRTQSSCSMNLVLTGLWKRLRGLLLSLAKGTGCGHRRTGPCVPGGG